MDDYIAKNGEKDLGDYANRVGFEPGTHNRLSELSGYKVGRFESEFPLIDIRHTNNLTSSKWSPDQFRSPKNAKNWKEKKAWEIEGWDFWVKDSSSLFDVTSVSSI